MSKRTNSNKDMEKMLNNFKQKEVNPTAAIVEPLEKSNNSENSSKELSDIVKRKKRIEDSHTRRTFLVKNELLERLDNLANKVNNTGFKTEFINYIMEKGLSDLEKIEEIN